MKRYLISKLICFLTAALIVGGVSATFNYAQNAAVSKSQTLQGTIEEFYYGIRYPESFPEDFKNVVNAAVKENGGLNSEIDGTGTGTGTGTGSSRYAFLLSNVCDSATNEHDYRDGYGYVGTMDGYWGTYFEDIPSGVSVILTVTNNAIKNKLPFYMYITSELDNASVGDTITVYKVTIEYIDGKYTETECLGGYSEVVYYETWYDYSNIKSFAFHSGKEIWYS